MKQKNNICKDISDEELIKKSLINIDYFACVYERYESKLIRYILRISAFSYEEAEEILQESFIKIWKNINGFDQKMKFSSWAYTIVHNETLSHFRKSKSFGKDLKQNLDYEMFVQLPGSIDIESDVHKTFEGEEIHRMLLEIPIKYRDVLVLKFIEDKSYTEISNILKKPEGTIATLINRAKKYFQEVYKKHNNE